MEEIKTQAIVLKAVDYKEGGKLLTLFSLENGIIVAKIRGVSKPKAKLAFAAQPFCFGEYILVEKAGYSVVNCSAIETFYNLTADFDRFVAASQVLEIVSILAREGEPNVSLFVEMLKAFKALEFSSAAPLALLIKFMIAAMGNAGYKMKLDECPICGSKNAVKEKFSLRRGAIMCAICSDNESISLSPAESSIIRVINENDYEKLQKIHFASLESLIGVTKIFIKYFEEKTGEPLKVLRDYI